MSNYLIWISLRKTVSHRSVYHTSACVSACLPRDRWKKGRSEQREKLSADRMPARLLLHSPPPVLVSVYHRVNLLTDVPAWKTSASSLRHLMLAQSVQRGYQTHACTVWSSVMPAWRRALPDSVENTTASADRLLAQLRSRTGDTWRKSKGPNGKIS